MAAMCSGGGVLPQDVPQAGESRGATTPVWSKCRPEPPKAFTFQTQPVRTWLSGEGRPGSRGDRGGVETEKFPGSPSSESGGRAWPPSSPAVAESQQTCRRGLKPDLAHTGDSSN